jgi:hypothetical protein
MWIPCGFLLFHIFSIRVNNIFIINLFDVKSFYSCFCHALLDLIYECTHLLGIFLLVLLSFEEMILLIEQNPSIDESSELILFWICIVLSFSPLQK